MPRLKTGADSRLQEPMSGARRVSRPTLSPYTPRAFSQPPTRKRPAGTECTNGHSLVPGENPSDWI